jgi:hypothetical protein
MTDGRPNADRLQPQVDGVLLPMLFEPCGECPSAEVWTQTRDAWQSPDPRIHAAGELGRQLLNMSEATQPVVVESVAFTRPTTMCCNGALRLVETILLRTEHAVSKSDAA